MCLVKYGMDFVLNIFFCHNHLYSLLCSCKKITKVIRYVKIDRSSRDPIDEVCFQSEMTN